MKKLTCLLAIAYGAVCAQQAQPPNIIIIFTDDQGYNDLGVFHSPNIETPEIDAMAAEGAVFTDFYSAANVCTPSRAALLTGSYARRVNMNNVMFPTHTHGLNPNEITIADLMKRGGYHTAAIGKWHLGDLPKFLPINNGFDMYYGIPYSNDMEIAATMTLDENIVLNEGWTLSELKDLLALPQGEIRSQTINKVPLLRDDKVVEYPADQSTVTQRYTTEAIAFMARSVPTGRPFFIYLAHTMPHIPLYVTPEFKNSSDQGPYGDCIQEIDFNAGRILDTLADLGIDSNTLVIYTTDNGPWKLNNNRGGSAGLLRGFKFETWEGGHRVPTVMRWPGQIPPGTVQHNVASTIDLLPTLAFLAGVPLPEGETIEGMPWKIDGVNIWNLMRGDANATRGRPFFYQRANNAEFHGARLGNWKIRLGALYDLSKDIHEDNDVADANPAKTVELQALLDDFVTEVAQHDRPRGNENTPDPAKGCTYPLAANYDENARQDDGSCEYPAEVMAAKVSGMNIITEMKGNMLLVRLAEPGGLSLFTVHGRKLFDGGQERKKSYRITHGELSAGVFILQVVTRGRVVQEPVFLTLN